MTDKTPPSDSNEKLTKQTLHALTHVKRDQKDLLDNIKLNFKDGLLPINKPIIDKITEIFCTTTNDYVSEAAANCLYEAALARTGSPFVIDNILQATRHALETGQEDQACTFIYGMGVILKTKQDWADNTINDNFQALKDIKIPPRAKTTQQPDAAAPAAAQTPLDKIKNVKDKVIGQIGKLSHLFNPKAAPASKVAQALSSLQLSFDEVLISQFNNAIKNEKAKGLGDRVRYYLRRIGHDLRGD